MTPRLFAIAATLTLANPVLSVADEALDHFEKRVRPLLVKHCYECHGMETAEGNLRLDLRSGWKRGGNSGPAIVPGDPARSLLFKAVSYTDAKLQMPPPEAGGRLTDGEVQVLHTWIRNGAPDPRTGSFKTHIQEAAKTHWAFQPLRNLRVPPGKHPIDHFISRKLKQSRIATTGPADLSSLIRRMTYDLLGLPPTPQQQATTREQLPGLIDSLLTSPHYGERWGRHWLDVGRFSDAKDGVLMYGDARIRPFAYTYRDYVIRAFNSDKPFDQFIREQLAAEQLGLPDDSPDLAAMGLLTLGRLFDRNQHDVIDDQIDVITRGFLGLTTSCARCHDHKFDPIPTADYYSLYGIFASSEEPYHRPRIEAVTQEGAKFKKMFSDKLAEIHARQDFLHQKMLNEARGRTRDHLILAATTEPDLAETTIFFLSLIPGQPRPQITYAWRQLIASRAVSGDPIFGPWHDLMNDPTLQEQRWRDQGVDDRIIRALVREAPPGRLPPRAPNWRNATSRSLRREEGLKRFATIFITILTLHHPRHPPLKECAVKRHKIIR